jgi:hypothetical protein
MNVTSVIQLLTQPITKAYMSDRFMSSSYPLCLSNLRVLAIPAGFMQKYCVPNDLTTIQAM